MKTLLPFNFKKNQIRMCNVTAQKFSIFWLAISRKADFKHCLGLE